jgi:hypothetical protein
MIPQTGSIALVSQRLSQPQQFVLRPLIDEGSLNLPLRNPWLPKIHRIILA